jgi:hypothetical protein
MLRARWLTFYSAGDAGAATFAEHMESNMSITSLDLSGNSIGELSG